jgi:endonuclease YncB( thermonuclease family)
MQSYDYRPGEYRGQCLNVVDGDTADLFLDLGFREYARLRVRLFGIDTPEMNSKDLLTRAKAVEAKAQLALMLRPTQVSGAVLLGNGSWALRVVTYKDPDSFGRWLADIWTWEQVIVASAAPEGVVDEWQEVHVNQRLIEMGLAELYIR